MFKIKYKSCRTKKLYGSTPRTPRTPMATHGDPFIKISRPTFWQRVLLAVEASRKSSDYDSMRGAHDELVTRHAIEAKAIEIAMSDESISAVLKAIKEILNSTNGSLDRPLTVRASMFMEMAWEEYKVNQERRFERAELDEVPVTRKGPGTGTGTGVAIS